MAEKQSAPIRWLLKSLGVGLLLIASVSAVLFGLVWIGMNYWPVFAVLSVLAWALFFGFMFTAFTER